MPQAAIAAADPQFVAPLLVLADRLGAWVSGQHTGSCRPGRGAWPG
jgi:hypothetical protein